MRISSNGGCLSRCHAEGRSERILQGGDYELMSDNGSTWGPKGDRAQLRDYVGQTGRVTGSGYHQKMHDAKERAKDKTENNPKEHGHLTVNHVRPFNPR